MRPCVHSCHKLRNTRARLGSQTLCRERATNVASCKMCSTAPSICPVSSVWRDPVAYFRALSASSLEAHISASNSCMVMDETTLNKNRLCKYVQVEPATDHGTRARNLSKPKTILTLSNCRYLKTLKTHSPCAIKPAVRQTKCKAKAVWKRSE